MKNKDMDNSQSEQTIQEINLAMSLKLALLSGVLVTIGDAIATYAAKIAIDEAIQDNITQREETQEQEQRMQSLEKQSNY
ncbi:hypothetical protein AJ85_00940 [Alkalihalobacillus alcalophilus ATCC 27647 = CGMCC 1.3604]|uniref:Translation initiation factor 2 n=1 Tax=Alkalihalobacillus alcalophilus ATCC 27647 = CGMCC 1.3604 TaxID=1218173 RepID=A0A4S4K2N6_ALKAL|nr:hypothetical protein [Alkalihalobacillus alcalophilus]MED1561746.1 hypothetical protein [Alkalihalobacillus alcalophilus]THG91895.1 hypothetical protein AJ85_00940 [Alkalihalobacillus alcalophilus ATCC 27647 = CGMCC 1.3604]